MQIIVAEKGGFCFGVKRAIDMVFNLAKETKEGVYTFGPLIHNPQVVNDLMMKGIKITEDVHSLDIKTLIIRTHGVPPKVYEEISKMGYKVVDATCPFVKKAQHYTRKLKDEGYQVIILGDRDHPEVRSLLGFAGDDAVVVKGNETIPPLKKRVGIIAQTTTPLNALKKLVGEVVGLAKEVKVHNTICNSTSLRLEETRNLAKEVDIMIIVGGRDSANTTQLANLSREICPMVCFIEGAGELKDEWFTAVGKVGITGGASTPRWVIDEVAEKIKKFLLGDNV
ncbi:MAG: 4-hydroxy-3-methylbut-2-enyl diphosphate reductase [Nitrospirae bacterium]|nr:4-hydroxy-3-methylbut-2-enyl diphosphate reductase [Nitrospirota bacterium]